MHGLPVWVKNKCLGQKKVSGVVLKAKSIVLNFRQDLCNLELLLNASLRLVDLVDCCNPMSVVTNFFKLQSIFFPATDS